MLSLAQPLAISSRRRLPSISTMRAAANAFESPSPSLSQPPLGQQLFSGQTGEPSQGLFTPPIETSTNPPITISPMEEMTALNEVVGTVEQWENIRAMAEENARQRQQNAWRLRGLTGQQGGGVLPYGQSIESTWQKSNWKQRFNQPPPSALASSLEFQGLLENYGLQGMNSSRPAIGLQMFNEYQKVRPYVAPIVNDPELTLATINQLMDYGIYQPSYLGPLWSAMKAIG